MGARVPTTSLLLLAVFHAGDAGMFGATCAAEHVTIVFDAMADNRGELLFELRGASQRQFALYRVLRGTAEKIFVTGGGEYGIVPGE